MYRSCLEYTLARPQAARNHSRLQGEITQVLSYQIHLPVPLAGATHDGGTLLRDAGLIRCLHHRTARQPLLSCFVRHQELGYNYRITDIQCALGITQLKRLGVFVARPI